MQRMKVRILFFLLIGSFTVATPTIAEDSATDVSSTHSESHSFTFGNYGVTQDLSADTQGKAGSISSLCTGTNPNLKCTFRPSIDYVRIKGSYRKTYKRGGNKQKLIIRASIGKKSDLVTQENFNNRIGVVRAIFPDGETCEFEATSQNRKFFKYTLHLKINQGVFKKRRGHCLSDTIPSDETGKSIIIEFDCDGNTLTPNTEIARIIFYEDSTAVQTGISLGAGTVSSGRLDQLKAMNTKWLRFQMGWRWIAADGPSSFKWTTADSIVNSILGRGMQPLAVLSTTPAWARLPVCTESQWCAPKATSIVDFAQFAAAAADRYPQIRVWEIWNEPNQAAWWRPGADPESYTALLKAAYRSIKAVNPNAIVITGGMAPSVTNEKSFSPIEFLQEIYTYGGRGSFDGVGHHPYCYDAADKCPDFYASWSAWSQMNDTTPSLRSVMKDHGDAVLKIWATEFGAPTGSSRAVTETQQANMLSKAYELFRAYDWAEPVLIWHKDRDQCNNSANKECFFGLIRNDGSKKQAYDAFVQEGK